MRGLALAWVVVAGIASAAPGPMERFAHANADYRAGRYREALAAFEELQAAKPSPGLLKRIADCKEKLGDLNGAIAALHTYLQDPASPDRNAVTADLSRLVKKQSDEQLESERKLLEQARKEQEAAAVARAAAEESARKDREAAADAERARAAAEAEKARAIEAAEKARAAAPPPAPVAVAAPAPAPVPEPAPVAKAPATLPATRIEHIPADANTDRRLIRARVFGGQGLEPQARVHVRGGPEYLRFALTPGSEPGVVQVLLPKDYAAAGYEYYLALAQPDGAVHFTDGTSDTPFPMPGLLPNELHHPAEHALGDTPPPVVTKGRPGAVVLGIIAGAAMAAGTVMIAVAQTQKNKNNNNNGCCGGCCPGNTMCMPMNCNNNGGPSDSDIQNLTFGGIAAAGGGVALAVTGLYLAW